MKVGGESRRVLVVVSVVVVMMKFWVLGVSELRVSSKEVVIAVVVPVVVAVVILLSGIIGFKKMMSKALKGWVGVVVNTKHYCCC